MEDQVGDFLRQLAAKLELVLLVVFHDTCQPIRKQEGPQALMLKR